MSAILVVFSGLPGSGKSTLARAISQKIDAIWLRVDLIEAALLKAGFPRSSETGLAAYLSACDLAKEHLRLGRNVAADAVNGVEPARVMWHDVATEARSDLAFIEVICSDRDLLRTRVESRSQPTPPLPLPTWDDVLRREYEPWSEEHLTVDTVKSADECERRILEYLNGSRASRVS